MKLNSFISLLFLISSNSDAACPSWVYDDLPACPAGDSLLLPETFPALGIVVSAKDSLKAESNKFNSDFIDAVLKASNTKTPLLFLTGTEETRAHVIDRLRLDLDLQSYLVQVPASYAEHFWVQDPFISLINPINGTPVIREIDGYLSKFGLFDKIDTSEDSLFGDIFSGKPTYQEALVSKMTESCELFSAGDTLPPTIRPSHEYRFDNSYAGGNIIGLPGSFCLHGDKQSWEGFAEHYCGSRENEIVISASWLEVGHVDEIVAVVPNLNRTDNECDFALVYSDPRIAFALLEQSQDQSFVAFPKDISPDKQIERYRKKNSILNHLCIQIQDLDQKSKFDCSTITGGDVIALFEKKPSFKIENIKISDEMRKSVEIISAAVRKRLSCDLRSIPLPSLFLNSVESTSESQLSEGRFRSYLPNVANLMVIENSVIAPYSHNHAFEKYIRNQYDQLKIKYFPIDSFSLHELDGNIHCATHKIPICRK